MERVHQSVGSDGLQIPSVILRRYGLERGATVVLELGVDGIRILPVTLGQEEIENLALRYLFTCLGDAVSVRVKMDDEDWRVSVHGSGIVEPLGELIYSVSGQLQADRSASVEEMQRRAMAVIVNQ